MGGGSGADIWEQRSLIALRPEAARAGQGVVVLYEAGPLGYTLYRELKAKGIDCLVCAPRSGEQKRKRRKNNTIDARSLTSDLSNYLNGKSGLGHRF